MKRIMLIIYVYFFALMCFAFDLRIGIIGGGPAGLVAASELMKKGYENVVVLEKASDVGGKVKTVFHKGKPYEMGAVVTAPDYKITAKIAKELELERMPTPPSLVSSATGDMVTMHKWRKKSYGLQELPMVIGDAAKFSAYVLSHKDFYKPGFAHTPKNMHENMEEFMIHQDMYSVLDIFRPIMVGCGYGYAESMPAPYWMKLMKTCAHEYYTHFPASPFYRWFADGWQGLWQELVQRRNIDVRLNTAVVKVETKADDKKTSILVDTTKGQMEFDRLIITVPHLAKNFMTFNSEEEAAIFGKVKTLTYKTTLVSINGLPQNSYIWLRENSYEKDIHGQPNDGKPVVIASYQDTNIYQIYQHTELGQNNDELIKIMFQTVNDIKGEITEIIAEHFVADYFPHFDAQAFKDGLPQKLIEMQGKNGVYYTGSLMNFETVELSAQHARHVIRKHF